MNKVILIGRLTKDPEIRTTSTGKKVASFSIAISDGKDSSGQDITQFFDVSAWDKLADITESYIKKGTRVAIVGSLRTRVWEDQNNIKRKSTDITAREIEILTSRAESEAMQQQNQSSMQSSQNTPAPQTPSQPATDNSSLPEINVDELDDINVQMPF